MQQGIETFFIPENSSLLGPPSSTAEHIELLKHAKRCGMLNSLHQIRACTYVENLTVRNWKSAISLSRLPSRYLYLAYLDLG
jgi:hypothetical protein